jgi:hypothetical protein
MKGHYEPRKKKAEKPFRQTRLVRIDIKTQIEVPVSVSDEDAIERYYQRHTTAIGPTINSNRQIMDDGDEVPQEELAAVLDDSEIPEEFPYSNEAINH